MFHIAWDIYISYHFFKEWGGVGWCSFLMKNNEMKCQKMIDIGQVIIFISTKKLHEIV